MAKIGEQVFSMAIATETQAKERARVSRNGHMYTPKKTRTFEAFIRDTAELCMYEDPVDHPIHVTIEMLVMVPKSWPKWKRNAALARKIFPSRGDVDNKMKAVTDAMNGVVYQDDRQIMGFTASVAYSDKPLLKVSAVKTGLSSADAEALFKGSSRVLTS
jgi:Holliday junction resolvase RusA-like endonuclease